MKKGKGLSAEELDMAWPGVGVVRW